MKATGDNLRCSAGPLCCCSLCSLRCLPGAPHHSYRHLAKAGAGDWQYARAPLKNPVNDAATMDATLKKLGFEVHTMRNRDLQHMEAAIDEFTASLGSGSLGSSASRGMAYRSISPTTCCPSVSLPTCETDVKYKAYPASRIQDKMEASGARYASSCSMPAGTIRSLQARRGGWSGAHGGRRRGHDHCFRHRR